MKILQVANKFPYPAKDGGSIATLSLSRSFAAQGHAVTVLAMNTSKHFTDISRVPEDLNAKIRLIGVPVNTDIRIVPLVRNFLFSRLPYNAERFVDTRFRNALEDLLKSESFDIIQLEGLYLAPYLEAIRKFSSARVVMRAHNIEHEIWERSIAGHAGIRKLYIASLARRIRRMELEFLNKYDAVVPITERDHLVLQKLGCRLPAHVVPMGVNPDELVPDFSRMEFPSVFHIGALDWMPNQEGLTWFLEKVWEKVLKHHPDLKFYLAGRNAPDHFKSLTYPNVRYLGEVADAYDFIRSKTVMIVPILSGSGMRIKIIEGMALGKAIVTTSIGTEGIATTSGENLFVADDPDEFAQIVCNLVENREKCVAIGENARKFVTEYYDNDVITRSLILFYEKLK